MSEIEELRDELKILVKERLSMTNNGRLSIFAYRQNYGPEANALDADIRQCLTDLGRLYEKRKSEGRGTAGVTGGRKKALCIVAKLWRIMVRR